MGSKVLFVLAFCIILSMYGGGFATMPAYLADIFGTQFVGAIHGRLLTAWATAGIIGPVVVNYIREFQIAAGVPRAQVYDFTMYILAGMLVLGLICNVLVKPLAPHWFMKPEEVAALAGQGRGGASAAAAPTASARAASTPVGVPSGRSSAFRWLGRLDDAAKARSRFSDFAGRRGPPRCRWPASRHLLVQSINDI